MDIKKLTDQNNIVQKMYPMQHIKCIPETNLRIHASLKEAPGGHSLHNGLLQVLLSDWLEIYAEDNSADMLAE